MGRFSDFDKEYTYDNNAEREKQAAENLQNDLRERNTFSENMKLSATGGNKAVNYTVLTDHDYAEASKNQPKNFQAPEKRAGSNPTVEKLIVFDKRYSSRDLSAGNTLFDDEDIESIYQNVISSYQGAVGKDKSPSAANLVKHIVSEMANKIFASKDDLDTKVKYIVEAENAVLDHLLGFGNPENAYSNYFTKTEKRVLKNEEREGPDRFGDYSEPEYKEYDVVMYDHEKIKAFKKQISAQLESQAKQYLDPTTDYYKLKKLESYNRFAKAEAQATIAAIYQAVTNRKDEPTSVTQNAELIRENEIQDEDDDYLEDDEVEKTVPKSVDIDVPGDVALRELTQKLANGEIDLPSEEEIQGLIENYYDIKGIADGIPRSFRDQTYVDHKKYMNLLGDFLTKGCGISKDLLANEARKNDALKEYHTKYGASPEINHLKRSLSEKAKAYNNHGFFWKLFFGGSATRKMDALSNRLTEKGVDKDVINLLKAKAPTTNSIRSAYSKIANGIQETKTVDNASFKVTMANLTALEELTTDQELKQAISSTRADFVKECVTASGESPERAQNGTLLSGKAPVDLSDARAKIAKEAEEEAQKVKDSIAADIREKEQKKTEEEKAFERFSKRTREAGEINNTAEKKNETAKRMREHGEPVADEPKAQDNAQEQLKKDIVTSINLNKESGNATQKIVPPVSNEPTKAPQLNTNPEK